LARLVCAVWPSAGGRRLPSAAAEACDHSLTVVIIHAELYFTGPEAEIARQALRTRETKGGRREQRCSYTESDAVSCSNTRRYSGPCGVSAVVVVRVRMPKKKGARRDEGPSAVRSPSPAPEPVLRSPRPPSIRTRSPSPIPVPAPGGDGEYYEEEEEQVDLRRSSKYIHHAHMRSYLRRTASVSSQPLMLVAPRCAVVRRRRQPSGWRPP
jgi:hypothetical protein